MKENAHFTTSDPIVFSYMFDILDLLRVARIHSYVATLHTTSSQATLFEGISLPIDISEADKASLSNYIAESLTLTEPSLLFNKALDLCNGFRNVFEGDNLDFFSLFRHNLALFLQGNFLTERAPEIGLPLDFIAQNDMNHLNHLWNTFWLLDIPTYLCLKITFLMNQGNVRTPPWYPHKDYIRTIYKGLPFQPLKTFFDKLESELFRQLNIAKQRPNTLNEWLRTATGLYIDFEFLMELHTVLTAMDHDQAHDEDHLKHVRRIAETRADLADVSIDFPHRLLMLTGELDQLVAEGNLRKAEHHLQFFSEGRHVIPESVAHLLHSLIQESSPIYRDPLQLDTSKIMKFKLENELGLGFELAYDSVRPQEQPSLKTLIHSQIGDQLISQWDDQVAKVPSDFEAHYNRSEALYWLGKLDSSLESSTTALELAPHFTPAAELAAKIQSICRMVVPDRTRTERETIDLINDGANCLDEQQITSWIELAETQVDALFFKTLYAMIREAEAGELPEPFVCRLYSFFGLGTVAQRSR